MSFGRSRLSQITRGTATLSAVAILLGAGLITPAQAAEGVEFTPTVGLAVDAASPLGDPVDLKVSLDAAAGEEWMQTSGTDATLSVRIDAYGEYADGAVPAESPTVPAGTNPTATEIFIADKGAGDYTFQLSNFDYNAGNYVFVASVVSFDGNNANVISSDVMTPFSQPTANTRLSLMRSVANDSGTGTVRAGLNTTTMLRASGFNNVSTEVTSVLYGPYATAPAESPTVPADAPIAGTAITTFSGGFAQTTGVPVPSAGFYVWHHTIAASDGFPAYTPTFAASGTVIQAAPALVVNPPVVTDPADPVDPVVPVVTDPNPVVVADPVDGGTSGGGTVTGSGSAQLQLGTVETAGGVYANCTEARADGRTNIKSTDSDFSANLDSDKDGVGCERDGSDAAADIDGGFAQVSSVDNTPFVAGGVALIVLALGLGAGLIVRKRNAVK